MYFHKVKQITDAHCGPAVLTMLLDALDIRIQQEDVAPAGGAQDTLEEHGMRVDQLALACAKMAPQAQFWYKYHSSLSDIQYLLSRGYPVGVEWQGLFYDSEEEELEDEDNFSDFGHYSIVSMVDDELGEMIIVDPYKDFVDQDRIIPIPRFLRRWWDTNEIRDPFNGKKRIIEDVRLLFFVTPQNETMPPDRNFKRFSSIDLENWYRRPTDNHTHSGPQ